MENVSWISDLALFGSWARIGRYLPSDRYGMGPQSTSENIGWSGSWISGSYNQYATATRPYTFGWIGFGVEWPYADKAEWGIRSKWLKNRLSADVSFYSNRDKKSARKIGLWLMNMGMTDNINKVWRLQTAVWSCRWPEF